MTQTAQNTSIYAGDDKILNFTIYDEDNNILDVSSLTSAQWVLKKFANTTDVLVTKTLSNDIDNSDGSNGILTVTIDAADTEDLTPGVYYHELRIKNSGNKIGVVSVGQITILPADPL